MKLTQQQIDDFHREGWLFLPELFSPEEVAYLAREARPEHTSRGEQFRARSRWGPRCEPRRPRLSSMP